MRYVPAIAVLLFLAIFLLMSAGCNTIAGIGRDIESAADGTHRALSDRYYDDQSSTRPDRR